MSPKKMPIKAKNMPKANEKRMPKKKRLAMKAKAQHADDIEAPR